ncbi:16S rRNA (cytosine(967)-C(5))-methyltransferase RsmB [Tuanshanicoccus lijuaniae]|uniref:16S rRNA (cytosine(967)-C(5))-methyltransferase RsmB n=1 Tax=Aerococcaceae bacterium zg-1292 TaxID=2774330 RepID=UPI0019373AF9|nr:16S rRNA (cytosine(967)-C(5))-methyltransferase RsmB [Aerococcaceae bacterium zg-1292]QQA37418.1 16S rRNA (cytosine(967)-C(5))-methyltransferase RsmB [Aerococcaceae bacterium zg-1292]
MKIKKRSEQQLSQSARWQALVILHQVEYEAEYSNVLIDRLLSQTTMSDKDQRLCVQLIYGVIQRRLTLNYYLEPLIRDKKMDSWVETLLRLSVYQMIFLDRIPQHAIVNEAVKIAKTNGHEGLGKFVNALLRQFLRVPLRELPNRHNDSVEFFSVAYSMPKWLVSSLIEWMDNDEVIVEALLVSLLENPHLSIRINDATKNRAHIQQVLLEESIGTTESKLSPYGLRVSKGNVVDTNAYQTGKITVQDESSMLVAPLGRLNGSERVLDACSAPGGKATHIAQLLNQGGHLTALDLSSAKLKKVDAHLARMGLADRVSTFCADAEKFIPESGELYDTIYLDAPCSGLGLMRRKPEIKYEKSAADIVALAAIQGRLLDHVATLLKPGGTLIYSTCTIAPLENAQQIESFLMRHPDFEIERINDTDKIPASLINAIGQVEILPHQFGTDGFFICRLKKAS